MCSKRLYSLDEISEAFRALHLYYICARKDQLEAPELQEPWVDTRRAARTPSRKDQEIITTTSRKPVKRGKYWRTPRMPSAKHWRDSGGCGSTARMQAPSTGGWCACARFASRRLALPAPPLPSWWHPEKQPE